MATGDSTPGAVFLSYASEDADIAQQIAAALGAAGIEVWFDRSELKGGDVWDHRIRQQIQDCVLFIPVISVHTQQRLEGYFRREWKLAADRTHDMADEKAFLVPVAIDATSERTASVPEKFRAVQWTRLGSDGVPTAFVQRVSRLLASGSSSAPRERTDPATPQGPASAATGPLRQRAAVLWGLSAAVAAFLAAWGLVMHWRASPTSAARDTGQMQSSGGPENAAVAGSSIAVLPFVDLSEKHDQEYLGDGMAEELINLLVRVPRLKVIGRTSSFSYKGKTEDLRTIGHALGAAYIVEGSVRRSGDRVRVTAQLIDSSTGLHRWSETYDRSAGDTLAIQEEIAASIGRELEVEVSPLLDPHNPGATVKPEAYDSYLRGLHAFNRFDKQGFEDAEIFFRQSREADPSFAPSAQRLASTLSNQAALGFRPWREGTEAALAQAEIATKLDPKSPSAHATLAEMDQELLRWDEAKVEISAASALSPENPLVLHVLVQQRQSSGDFEGALRAANAEIAADPLSVPAYWVRESVYMNLGRFDDAERDIRRQMAISPHRTQAHEDLAATFLLAGKPDAALSELDKAPEGAGKRLYGAMATCALHHDPRSVFAHEEASGDALEVAEMYAMCGRTAEALHWLEIALSHERDLAFIKSDPFLKSIRGEPRYKAILSKLGLSG
jgi:TolB-like protein/tetratricopeptide (TPR) repeat protein